MQRSILIILIGALVCSFGCARDESCRSFVSPANTYLVQLCGQFGATSSLLVENRVRATFAKGHESLGTVESVWTNDSFDSSFDSQWKSVSWPTLNLLRFTTQERGSRTNRLTIVNRTGATLEHVFVEAIDLLFVLELPAGDSVTSQVASVYRANQLFVRVQAMSEDRRVLRWAGDVAVSGDLSGAEVLVSVDEGRIEAHLTKGSRKH